VHLKALSGKNLHHIAESMTKAFAVALRQAVEVDPRREGSPSTKGTLERLIQGERDHHQQKEHLIRRFFMKRKEKILEILKEKKEVSVKELSKFFNVSEMTIYRDIKELEKEGEIKRKHGSVLLNEKDSTESLVVDTCPICDKPITRAYPYRITVEE